MSQHERWLNSNLEYVRTISYLFPTKFIIDEMWVKSHILYAGSPNTSVTLPKSITFKDLVFFAIKMFELEEDDLIGRGAMYDALFDELMEMVLSDVQYEMTNQISAEEYHPIYDSACVVANFVHTTVISYYESLRPYLMRWFPVGLFEQHDLYDVDIIDGDIMLVVTPRDIHE